MRCLVFSSKKFGSPNCSMWKVACSPGMSQLRDAETIGLGIIGEEVSSNSPIVCTIRPSVGFYHYGGSQDLVSPELLLFELQGTKGSCRKEEQIFWCRFSKTISVKSLMVLLTGTLGLGGNFHQLRTPQLPKRLRQLFQKRHGLVGGEGGPGEFLGHQI